MTDLVYTPARDGGWLALVDGPRMLLLSPSGWDLADDARRAIGQGSGFEASIDVLTRSGFTSIPDFVLLEDTGASLRTLLRGPVRMTVIDGSGTHEQDGAGISTWTERTFTGVTSATVTVNGAEALGGVAVLPLAVGSAIIADCRLAPAAVGDEAEPAAEQQPGPEPEPEPEPEPAPVSVPHPEPDAVSEATVSSPPDGETVVRPSPTITTPAAPEASPDSPPTIQPAEQDGDHDGNTILSSDLPKSRTRPARPTAVPPPPAQTLVLELSTGAREPLDQAVIVGRAPTVSQVSGSRMPRLVTVGGADHDISRNHAQVSVEGGTVVVTDLHSRNGTVVMLPGKSPQKLRAGEPTSVIVGTVVDLGGGITLTVGEE